MGRLRLESELGGDYDLLADRTKSLAHKFLVGERAVHFSSVEECDTEFNCFPNQRDHFLLVPGRAVAKAHSHAAEAEGGDFQVVSEFAFLHFCASIFNLDGDKRQAAIPFAC